MVLLVRRGGSGSGSRPLPPGEVGLKMVLASQLGGFWPVRVVFGPKHAPPIFSVVMGLESFEASSDGWPRWSRLLFLFLPPKRFLALLIRPRARGRAITLVIGLGLPFL